jgi:hypothetical protein
VQWLTAAVPIDVAVVVSPSSWLQEWGICPIFVLFGWALSLALLLVGLHTIPSDGYGHTIDGQVMGIVQLSTVHQGCPPDP